MDQVALAQWSGKVLPKVKEMFQTVLGIEGELKNGSLFLFPDQVGAEGSGSVLVHVDLIPMQDADDPQNYFANIFTIVAKDVARENFDTVSRRLDQINLTGLLGFYGLNENTREVYHKNVVLLRENDPDAATEYLAAAIRWSLIAVDANYESLMGSLD